MYRFRSITRQYYRKSDGVIVVFDVTSESSFLVLQSWLNSIRDEIDNNIVLMVLENKWDLIEDGSKEMIISQNAIDQLISVI